MMDSLTLTPKILPSDIDTLSTNGWLSTRGKNFRSALLELALVRCYAEGETLYHFGDPADCLHAVVSGSVKVTVPADDGQEFTAQRSGAGFWVGDLAMLAGQTRLVSVVATSETRTLFIPTARIVEMIGRNPSFYEDFYALSYMNMQSSLRILANLAVTQSDTRLALRLLHLDEHKKRSDNWIKLSQEDLAAMAAISVPTLQRALRKLTDAGLVEAGYGQVRVLDRKKLLGFCQT